MHCFSLWLLNTVDQDSISQGQEFYPRVENSVCFAGGPGGLRRHAEPNPSAGHIQPSGPSLPVRSTVGSAPQFVPLSVLGRAPQKQTLR